MAFTVEKCLPTGGTNDLRIFLVDRLGVFFEDHLILKAFAAQLTQVGLVDSAVMDFKEVFTQVVVLITSAIKGKVVVVDEVEALRAAGFLEVRMVRLDVQVEEGLVADVGLAQGALERGGEVEDLAVPRHALGGSLVDVALPEADHALELVLGRLL